MLPGKKYTPEDLLRIAWRRRWVVVVPFVVIATSTFVVARLLPDRYRASTVIMVVPQRVPESYVRSTVTTRIEDRLQTISQQIMSRTRLERVINELQLYTRERQRLPMEDVVEQMRRDVDVRIAKRRGLHAELRLGGCAHSRLAWPTGSPACSWRRAPAIGPRRPWPPTTS